MKKILFLIVTIQLILLGSCKTKELTAEQLERRDKLTEKIEKPDFLYIPNNAQPAQGRTINLDNSFSLKVKNDTIEAYLPYYGRAYTAPMNPTDSGIKFISTDFEYSSIMKKNGTYDIIIEPKDISNRYLQGIVLYLNVSNSGYGSLNVQSTNRQNISFYGTIE
ncbi:MAG: DUF4251 domain-containing protein [Dysgonomonas sp.]|nr:DUF4251 domain-containing protein [Dysgonomonas sp.]